MKALVLGSNGQLGQALATTIPAEIESVGLSHKELDVTNADNVNRAIVDIGPSAVINASAYTAVDKAESDAENAQAVNVDGARNIATAVANSGARLVHISTDFVFDGEASEPYKVDAVTNPLGVYGRTKRDGEAVVLETLPEAVAVVRTAWLYSNTGANFVTTMLRLMAEREELGIVADQRGTPTSAYSLAHAIWAITKVDNMHGVYHWTDAGECSWYEFAVAIQGRGVRTWVA